MRFCIDYRNLDVTREALPQIDDLVEALSGARWFSTLDLESGYWQVDMEKNDKEKTAFSIGSGLWQFSDAIWTVQCASHARETNAAGSVRATTHYGAGVLG